MNPSNPINLAALCDPFPSEDVEWRIQKSGFNKNKQPYAVVVAYIDNRAIMERLDAVCGPENWQNQFATTAAGALCGIGIRLAGEWVWKWDGAENTDIEAMKGGLSGAMKRAAVHWGIGRYLYKIPASFAVFDERGRYRDEIKEKNGTRREWLRWNPPPLPEWALPRHQQNGNGGKNGHGQAPPEQIEQQENKPLAEQIKDILDCGLISQEQKKAGYAALKAVDPADVESLLGLRNCWAGRKKEAEAARKALNPQVPAGSTAGIPVPEAKGGK